MLNDYRCIEVCSSFFEAIQRREGISTMVVKRRYPVAFVIFMEVCQVTGDQNGTHIFQAYQQAVMAWGMAGCVDDDGCAISKHVFVADDCFELTYAALPVSEGHYVGARGGWCCVDTVPIAFAYKHSGTGERSHLPSMVSVVMADTDKLDLFGLDTTLG